MSVKQGKITPVKPEQITAALLLECGIDITQARAFEKPLQYACNRFGINTIQRLCAFIGQCAVESSDFTRLDENLYYTSIERLRSVYPSSITSDAMAQGLLRNPQALANKVYAGKGGNGNEMSGDGWRYRGRGMIQLTLKSNYSRAAYECQRPYVDQPDLVAQPLDAAITAAWYWGEHGCNTMADNWDIDRITRAINPAMLGKIQRRSRCDKVLDTLNNLF